MSKISFIKSDDRKYNIERCLSLIKSEITAGLKNATKVVIKPNCISDSVQLSATHVDALEATLKFIKPFVSSQIIVAGGAEKVGTLSAFKTFDYLSLQEIYDFTIVDLNNDEYEEIELIDRFSKPFQARIAKTILESDYLITLTPPATDSLSTYSGAIKNIANDSGLQAHSQSLGLGLGKIGSYFKKVNPWEQNRQSKNIIDQNICAIYNKILPNLAIIDGFEAMEGNGPVHGDLVPSHFAVTSSDPIAADWLACKLMDIDVSDVGYLTMLGVSVAEKDDNFIIGDNWKNEIRHFKTYGPLPNNKLETRPN